MESLKYLTSIISKKVFINDDRKSQTPGLVDFTALICLEQKPSQNFDINSGNMEEEIHLMALSSAAIGGTFDYLHSGHKVWEGKNIKIFG